MSWVLLALQLGLSAALIVAATGKVLLSDDLVAALRLSHLPEAMIKPLAVAVPLLEVGLALALVLSPPGRLTLALIATAVLLALFTLWMGWVQARQLRVRCGCFGGGGGDVGPRT